MYKQKAERPRSSRTRRRSCRTGCEAQQSLLLQPTRSEDCSRADRLRSTPPILFLYGTLFLRSVHTISGVLNNVLQRSERISRRSGDRQPVSQVPRPSDSSVCRARCPSSRAAREAHSISCPSEAQLRELPGSGRCQLRIRSKEHVLLRDPLVICTAGRTSRQSLRLSCRNRPLPRRILLINNLLLFITKQNVEVNSQPKGAGHLF